ncbi:MAG: hypothetical protein KDA84_05980, partial [Planctomycetaceae bacterium]|nr:hypothetical protein [Planctomycetaceae bacterium]
TETRTLRTPQFAWRLAQPNAILLTQEPRLPKRRASVIQEGRTRKGELRWNFTATIDTTTAPAFRHVLQVPAELIIDSISILEDETERLIRWSRLGNRLELVLTDGTTGTQSVELTGHLPLDMESGTQVPLPLIQIVDATISDSRMRIYQDFHTDHKLHLVGVDDLPPLDANGIKTERGIPRLLAGVHLTNNNASPALAIGAPLKQIHVSQALFIAPSGTNRFLITTWIHLNELEDSPQRFSVHLPAPLTKDFRVELLQNPNEIIPYETIAQTDQSLDLVFDSVALQEQNTLRIESSVVRTDAMLSTTPKVDVSQAKVDDFLLGISSTLAIQSAESDPIPTPLSQTEFPHWILQNDQKFIDLKNTQLFRASGERLQLIQTQSPADRQTSPPLIQTNLWLTDPRAIVGETHISLHESDQELLTWSWPSNTMLRGALLDGELLSATIDRDAQSLQLSPSPSLHPNQLTQTRTLVLHWVQELEKPIPRFGQIDLVLPKPASETIQSANITVFPTNQCELITNEGLMTVDQSKSDTGNVDSGELVQGHLPIQGDSWPLSFWTMDSRSENVLVVCVLLLIIAGVSHWGLKLNSGEWLHNYPAIAWALLGIVWWACLAGSFVGFSLVALSPLYAIATKLKTVKTSRDVTIRS